MIVFGEPPRNWVEINFGLTLNINAVNFIAKLNNTPVIAANHPSRIFYNTPHPANWTNPNFTLGVAIMQQDLISSCW